MKMHAIIEIEEGSMNVLVGGAGDGGRATVARSARLPLPDLGRETVENALRLRNAGDHVHHVGRGENR